MRLQDYNTVVKTCFALLRFGSGVVEMGEEKENESFRLVFCCCCCYFFFPHLKAAYPWNKAFPWATQFIYRLTALFKMSFIGCTVSYEINTPFLSRTPCSWIRMLFGLAMKVIASTLTKTDGWVSSLSSNCCLSQFIDWHNIEHNTHSVKFYIHTHKHPETSYSVCGLFLPPQQQYETEEYPEIGNQSVISSPTEESQFDLMSQFHFPFEVTIRAM